MRNKLVYDKLEGFGHDLSTLAKAIEQKNNLIDILKEELICAREQQKQLLDRLMARDFPEYSSYRPTEQVELNLGELNPFSDEGLAGEIVDETKSKE